MNEKVYIKNMMDEIIIEYLEASSAKAKQSIKEKGALSLDDAIPLILHSQFNHITHLEQKMATKDDIKNMATKDDIKFLIWLIGICFTVLALIQGSIGLIALLK